MLSRKITYAILIIISIFFYIFFLEKLSLYILVFVLSLPVVLLVILFIGKFTVKYKLSPVSDKAIKNENCSFNLNITNKSIFPFPAATVIIEYQNKLSDNADSFQIVVPIHPRTTQKLTFKLSSEYCGILNVRVSRIKIYDYIKLFSLNVKRFSSADVYVIPSACAGIIPENLRKTPYENSSEFSKEKSGDDPSEIFELKDYVPGDKINRIHWNLSSKQNQLITKHYSQTVDSPAAVICDITLNNNLKNVTTALEIVYGICFSLIDNNIYHKLYINGYPDPIKISDYQTLNHGYTEILKYSDLNKNNTITHKPAMINSKLYFITNKQYKDYAIPEINNNSEMKCFFVGNGEFNSDFIENDNVTVSHIDCEKFNKVPEDILM